MLPSKAAAQRARNRESRFHATIDPAPFAGLVYALLITMMAAPPNVCHGSGVDLARTHNARNEAGAVREDAIKLTIARDGTIYLGTTRAESGDLPQQIRAAVSAGAERKVYLQPDSRARNSDVSIAVDAIRAAGISDVAIITEKPRPAKR